MLQRSCHPLCLYSCHYIQEDFTKSDLLHPVTTLLLSCFYWITWMLSTPPESIPIFHTGNHLMESENVSYTCQCFWNNKWNGTHLFKVADGQVSSFVVCTFQWCTFWKFLQHSICCCMHHCVNDFNKSWPPILNSLLKFCTIFFSDQPYTK